VQHHLGAGVQPADEARQLIMRIAPFVMIACTVCPAAPPVGEFAGWVRGQGGEIVLNNSGDVESVKLGFACLDLI
jgi:hypothetical protein